MSSRSIISNILSQEILQKVESGSHGIILMNLPSYDYCELVKRVNQNTSIEPIYFFVGFTDNEVGDLKKELNEVGSKEKIFYSVEDAEKYRHRQDINATRIVVVKRQIAKLSSLLWYEQISTNELYKKICINARAIFKNTNDAIINLWKVIDTKPIREIISFEQLVSYYNALENDSTNIAATITEKIFLLGLLPDANLLDSPKNDDIRKRLLNNYKTVQRIRYLDKSDLRILQAIDQNLEIQEKILSFYKKRDTSILELMTLPVVEGLLSSVNKNKKKKEKPTDDTPKLPDTNSEEKVASRNTKSDSIGVDLILENDGESIGELLEQIEEEFENRESGKKSRVIVESSEGIKTNIEFLPEIYNLIDTFISDSTFGGIVNTEESTAPDALSQLNKSNVLSFTEDYINEIKDKLISLAEEYPEEARTVLIAFEEYINERSKISGYAARLADSPMLKIAEHLWAENSFTPFIDSFAKLISLLKENFQKFSYYSASGTKEIVAQINSLDIIFIKSPGKIHAVLSPLNPLYLWKYIELSQRLKEDMVILSDADKEFLVRSADEIPNPLITVFVSSFISGDKDEVIAEAGKIGNLPIYSNENYVNQSTDGLDIIKRSIEKFLSVYQHSRIGLRIAFINPPDVNDTVKLFSDLILNELGGLHIDIFRTKETPYSWADTENIDEDILKLFSSNDRFTLKINTDITQLDKLSEKLERNSYHIVSLFDPSKRSVTEIKTENRLNLKIHPLCIPKIFNYDPLTDKLEIVPASTGNIFTEHHELVARLNDRPKGWHNTVVSNLEPVKQYLQSLMNSAEWLIIADSNLKNFEVSTIGSEKCIYYSGSQNREVGIYSANWSKLVDGLDQIVRRIGNYIPNKQCIEKLLNQVQLLNEKSILSIINTTSVSTFDKSKGKGTIGSAIAATWYKNSFKDSILASLDTDLARNWLKSRDDNTMSDLIGIRYLSENEAVIDIIEVKTHDGDFKIVDDENVDGTKEIQGHAVEQVSIINKLMNEILFEQGKVTSISRRELLRYQVFKILHNSSFSKNEKKRWTSFLNELFSANLESIKLNNIICYVNFNSNNPSDTTGTKYSSDQEIFLYQLNNDLITAYISGCIGTEKDNDSKAIRLENKVSEEPEEIISSLPSKIEQSTLDVVNYEVKDRSSEIKEDKNSVIHTQTSEEGSGVDGIEVPLNESSDKIDSALKMFIEQKAKAIRQAMKDFSIDVQEVDPDKALIAARFIRFRVKLRPGEVLSKVLRVRSDIAREIEAINEIFIDNERGTNYIYIDVPRESSDAVALLENLDNIERGVVGNLNVILGQDPSGEMVYLDLAKAPHLLTAGSTGSGKTIFLYSIIVSLISQYTAEELELVVIDPKQTDFIFFEDLPHLRNNEVIIEPESAVAILNELVNDELPRRTNLLRESRNRDLFTYNDKNKDNPLKPILVVVDEYADLIAAADLEGNKEEFERNMIRLAQRSRNVGIHLVIATQRPSADIVTSRLKANVPTRISFSLPANQDSRTILDASGAEDLLGKGDMLYSYNGEIRRLQGLFISEQELQDYIDKKL